MLRSTAQHVVEVASYYATGGHPSLPVGCFCIAPRCRGSFFHSCEETFVSQHEVDLHVAVVESVGLTVPCVAAGENLLPSNILGLDDAPYPASKPPRSDSVSSANHQLLPMHDPSFSPSLDQKALSPITHLSLIHI